MDPNDDNNNKDNNNDNNNRKPTTNTNNNNLPLHLRNHLIRVYSTLTGTTATTVLGASLTTIPTIPPILSLLLAIGIIFVLNSTRPDYLTQPHNRTPLNQNYRLLLLLLYGFLQGTLLITATPFPSHHLLLTTLFYTLLVFASFTMAALSTERQSLLSALRVPLMAGLMILLMTSLFLPFSSSIEVYFGLLVFIGFILYDTQLIVERADYEMSYLQQEQQQLGEEDQRRGDYVSHAMELFMDLYNLFIRILELFQMQQENNRSSRRRRRRS
jgi:FtsH-binding integral membrane protein